MKIRRGDLVVVIAGNEASDVPKRVVQVLDGGKKLVVEGVNKVQKHVRRGHPRSPQGGRLSLEMPIDSSNVKFFCDACNNGVRVGYRYIDDGSKERFCKKCGKSVGVFAAPRAAYAKK